MSAPPLLPWEVIERIINYSSDDTRTLHHLSLTCRQLRPRSLCLMVADIYLSSRRHVFTLCDFLQAHPHLRPLVRALTIHLHEFAPFPLLHVLPNISRLTFDSSKLRSRPRLNTLPNPILTSCRLYGTRIRDLCLSRLTFQSFQDFARLTLAFTNLQRLILLDVRSKDAKGGSSAQLELSKQRLSRHLRLRTLVMDGAVEEKVSSLLFKAVELTVETLYLEVDEGIITTHARLLSLLQTLQKSIWVQLRSLTLSVLQAESRTIKAIAAFLTEFHHPKLMNVVVHLHSDSIHDLLRVIASVEGGDARVRLDLDQALRFFNHPGIDFCLKAPVSARRTGMWIHELGKYFTSLQGGGSLRILCDRTVTTGDFDHEATCLRSWVAQHGRERPPSRSKHEISVAASHEGRVRSLVYSTDSQWMATASDDSTIILWDSEGRIVREWEARDLDCQQ
ncbi:hypothetical protein BD310DRAFT_103815 [Dichomitus squalens]|uniref:Uncharacterized protein n=1 Tax=Dichomitus squalens TaxID=114155 RepID=A0A4Q9PJ93_9APHY|nr:hypothetical protein BD310DRAFT_103815 [Dichomitus squalens]